MHAADALVAVSQLGGRLELAGDRLRALLPRDCPEVVRSGIREHKLQLLALLRLEFVMIHSAALHETVFFAADEQTKAALAAAGVELGCIYAREELGALVTQHQREPITAGELLRIHRAKQIFNGRITADTGAPNERQV